MTFVRDIWFPTNCLYCRYSVIVSSKKHVPQYVLCRKYELTGLNSKRDKTPRIKTKRVWMPAMRLNEYCKEFKVITPVHDKYQFLSDYEFLGNIEDEHENRKN